MNYQYKLIMFILCLFTSDVARSDVGDKIYANVQGQLCAFTVTSETPYMNRFPGTVSLGWTTSTSYIVPPDWEGEVIIPKQIIVSGNKYNVTGIADKAFIGCTSITSVVIPEGVNKIGEDVFSGCSSLVSVEFPSTYTGGIPKGTFAGCTSLTRFEMGFGNTIGVGAFEGCTSLKDVEISGARILYEKAFRNCIALEKIVIPASVMEIHDYVFDGCTSLSEVYVESSNLNMKYSIHDRTYNNISPNATLYVPLEKLSDFRSHSLYNKAFSEIKQYTKVGDTFTNIVTSCEGVGDVLFQVTSFDESFVQVGDDESVAISSDYSGAFVIPDTSIYGEIGFYIKGVGKSAFMGTNITSIQISEGVTYIKENAFAGCTNLTSVSLPGSMKSISAAFIDNENLRSVSVCWKKPAEIEVASNNFEGVPADATLYVPAGTAERYAEHPVWGKFANIIEASPISVGDVTARYGSQVALPIYLKNEELIAGLQFKLTLPDGVTAKEEDGLVVTSTTDRTKGFTILGRKDPDEENSYLFIALSLSGDNIEGNEGAFMHVMLNVTDTLSLGDYSISIVDITLTNSLFAEQTPEGSYSDLTVTDKLPGDANGDGTIDVTDIVGIANKILGRPSESFDAVAADVDGDGSVDVTDIVVLANIILHNSRANAANVRGAMQMLDPQ